MAILFYHKSTCGTCRKARAYLDEKGVAYELVDIISGPPSRELLEATVDQNNVKAFLNPRSAIYRQRKLGQNVPSKPAAINLMLRDPNLIKRPVIIKGRAVVFGFNPLDLDKAIIS